MKFLLMCKKKYCPNCRCKDTWLYSFSNKDKMIELYDVINEKRETTKNLLSDKDMKFSDSEFNALISLDEVKKIKEMLQNEID